MSRDISPILADWPFDPHEMSVRTITGDDGELKVQMRVELGVLQMSVDGRPDGRRPNDRESLLDYHETRAEEALGDYVLDSEALDELYREGNLYYKRYLALFHLEWYEPMVRDTERNLRLFAFVRKHAKRRKEQWRFDQYRPYVLMMNARGRGMIKLAERDRAGALAAVEHGMERIREFLSEYGRSPADTECFELDFLSRWADELKNEPAALEGDEIPQLKTRLQAAIAEEDYERAALLRDKIRSLGALPPEPT